MFVNLKGRFFRESSCVRERLAFLTSESHAFAGFRKVAVEPTIEDVYITVERPNRP